MLTDRVSRLDIKSGQYTEYMLPRPTNIRRVYMDDSKPSLFTLWIGSNHGALDRQGRATELTGSATGCSATADPLLNIGGAHDPLAGAYL